MTDRAYTTTLRVRYGETDQMGTFYNARALDWFECGRTEALRQMGLPYAEMEDRGVLLPVVEAHVKYLGRARYDDLLEVRTAVHRSGKARLRFAMEVAHAPSGRPVLAGHTEHAIVDKAGKPVRPPDWLDAALAAPGDKHP